MVRLLSRRDIQQLLSMNKCMRSVEDAFRELANGTVISPPRTVFNINEVDGWIGVMPAYLAGKGSFATKIVSAYRRNPSIGLPAVSGLIVYFDSKTGIPLAVMDAGYLTALRTGAASGVATKYLAREETPQVAIIGSGVQARTQLEAVCVARHPEYVRVYSPNRDNRIRFAKEMTNKLNLRVQDANSAKEALKDADILITATSSREPVVQGEWLQEGLHINAIGAHSPDTRELDEAAVKRATVVVDSLEAAMKEAGEIIIPIKKGRMGRNHIHGELTEIIVGRKRGRTSQNEITLFKSVGIAVEDVAVAQLAYEESVERKVGVSFNLD